MPPTDESSYTNWFTVTAFRQLAINLAGSINKGDRVVVTGELKVRDWDNGERAGTSVEIVAFTVGHDLRWGTAEFTRTVQRLEQPYVASNAGAVSTQGEPSYVL